MSEASRPTNGPRNSFEFVTVASARARQLLQGCVPKVEGSPKPARRALQEVAGRFRREGCPGAARGLAMAFVGLGVTGGIGAYKSVEVARLLQKRGHRVQAVMTRNARRFIGPLTFEAITREPVITSAFSPGANANIEHIALASSIDVLLVAPATANSLAKFAHGLADDFLSALYLATRAPVLLAPAMNTNMWDHPATQANIATLRTRDVHFVDPGEGYLACGWIGAGRLAEPETIVDSVETLLARPGRLAGRRILVTAGPTVEDIDPVRFIGNRSSGRMGFAIARAAHARGAEVTLVAGPTEVRAARRSRSRSRSRRP